MSVEEVLANVSPKLRKKLSLGSEIEQIQFAPTPSFGLTRALNGGFPYGRQVLIYGNKSSGKSSFCLQLIADAQREGKVCAWIDANGNIYCGGSFMDTSYFDPIQKRKEYISSGEYDMFLVKFSQCLTKDMTIISLPNALKVAQTEAQYQWLDCDDNMNAISGETSREFKPKKNGNFAVAVTYGNCTDTSLCVNFSSNGIYAHNASQDIVFVYPNPFNDVFSIVVQQDIQLEVYDHLGSLVLAQTIPAGSCNIDLGNTAKGVYLLKLFNGKQTLIEKLIKI